MIKKFGWMPSGDQELLLKSALLTGNDCIGAWKMWKSRVDIERLDGGSIKLLPMVLHNVRKYDKKDSTLFDRMKSISMKAWYKNNMILNELSKLLKIFNLSGIEILLLKGIPLATYYYPNISLRPMGDFDILVPWEKSESAGKLLFSEGWKFKIKTTYHVFSDSFKVSRNGFGFIKSGLDCDLHWNVLKHTCYPGADSGFRERSRKIEIQNEKSLALSPEDQLIHVLEHGAYWSNFPSIRWIADSYLLLKREESLDWDYIVYKIRETYLYPMVYGMLEYINESFNISFPENFLNRLKEIRVTSIGKKLQNYTKVPRSELLWLIKSYFQQFLRYRIFLKDYRNKDQNNTILLFIRFLFFRWDVKNPFLFPVILIRKLSVKILRYAKRKLP